MDSSRRSAEFKSLLYQTIQTKTTSANGEQKPIPAQVGLGTRVAAVTSVYTQGALQASENDTDFAIVGDGFFAVRCADGETRYTRAGDFVWAVGTNGVTLTNPDGYPVLDSNNQADRSSGQYKFQQCDSIERRQNRLHDSKWNLCEYEPSDRTVPV